MRITIEIVEGAARAVRPRRSVLELPDGATVQDAVARVGIAAQEPWNAALDGRLAAGSDRLREGSRLLVFAAIEGG